MLAEVIGTPAMLEQTAEECVELAKACLKYARHLRNENPVHGLTEEQMRKDITEESADVLICMEELEGLNLLTVDGIDNWIAYKQDRMEKRLKEAVTG